MLRPNRTSQSDAVVGARSAWANLVSQAKLMLILVGVVAPLAGAVAEYIHVARHTQPAERELAAAWSQATLERYGPPGWVDGQIAFDYRQQHYVWPVTEVAQHPQVLAARDKVVAITADGWRTSFGIGLLVAGGLLVWLQRRGQSLREDNYLRGGWIVTAKQLRKLIRKQGKVSVLAIGPLPLGQPQETQHLLIEGTTGAGKTVAMRQLLEGVGRTWPALIYDTKGDFLAETYREDLDTILNPKDARAPSWTPWNEIESPSDAELVAKAWVPQPSHGNDYWAEAARQLFAAILQATPPEKRTNRELWRLISETKPEELCALLPGTSAHRLFVGEAAERMREGVCNTLITAVRGLQELDPDAKAGDGFSVTRWVRNAWTQSGDKGRLFLLCPPKHAPAILPILAVWLEVAAATMLDLTPDPKRRVLFAVDELPSLPKLDYLVMLAEQGRSFGASIVASVQSQAQLEQKYSKPGAMAFRGLFTTRVIFRAADPDSAELASRLLGEEDVDVSRESEGHGKRGHNLGSETRTRRLVTPTELLHLPNLTCYLRTAQFPITQIDLEPVSRPRQVPHLVPHGRGAWALPTQDALLEVPEQPVAPSRGPL